MHTYRAARSLVVGSLWLALLVALAAPLLLCAGGCETLVFREVRPDGSNVTGVGVGILTKPAVSAKMPNGGEIHYSRTNDSELLQAAIGAAVKAAIKP